MAAEASNPGILDLSDVFPMRVYLTLKAISVSAPANVGVAIAKHQFQPSMAVAGRISFIQLLVER